MPRIDTHHHMIAPDYRKALRQAGIDEAGGRALPDWSPQGSLQTMAELDIATAIVSVSTPGTTFLPDPADACAMARDLNDYGADLVASAPERFGFFATVPMPHIDESVAETVRALDDLTADGVVLLANNDGTYLGQDGQDDLWAALDERSAAAMCYTSGTTGHPKGIVYSHRSSYLHSMGACLGNAFALSERDRVLPVVPMFHANAWGLAYASLLSGAALIMPDRDLQPATLVRLIADERVTVAGGVPTIWAGVLAHMRAEGGDLSSLRLVIAGGSAVPHAMQVRFETELGVRLLQAWGMTETSPLASVANPPPGVSKEEEWSYRDSQGRLFCTVEGRLAGDGGAMLPSDGEAVGEIEVRGPWITGSYYQDDDPAKFHDGWLRTGDVGTMDERGFIRLTDRAKDVIKSGGEWISSMELENILMAHPDVAEAAVIGVADEKWGERPLAAVVLRSGAEVTAEKLRAFMTEQIPRWQLPERWCFVAEVPKTSVGKFSKRQMREAYQRGDYEIIEVR